MIIIILTRAFQIYAGLTFQEIHGMTMLCKESPINTEHVQYFGQRCFCIIEEQPL